MNFVGRQLCNHTAVSADLAMPARLLAFCIWYCDEHMTHMVNGRLGLTLALITDHAVCSLKLRQV